MKSVVDLSGRPNVERATNFLNSQYELDKSAVFLDIAETSQQVGANKSKQNKTELALSAHLARLLIKTEVPAKEIIILTDCTAQKSLANRFVTDHADLDGVEAHTVDGFQGGESSVVILNIVGNDRLGFLQNPKRLLPAVSRARDGLIILCNWKDLDSSGGAHHRSLTVLRELRQKFIAARLYEERVEPYPLEATFLEAHHVITGQTEMASEDGSQEDNDQAAKAEASGNWNESVLAQGSPPWVFSETEAAVTQEW